MEDVGQFEQFFAFGFEELFDGNACPVGDNRRDFVGTDAFLYEGGFAHFLAHRLFEGFFEFGKFAVLDFRSLREVVLAFGAFHLHLCRFDLFAQFDRLVRGFLFLLPLRLHRVRFFAHFGELLADFREPLFVVVLLDERGLLDFETADFSQKQVEVCGHRIELGLDSCARFVHEVDCLVGELSASDVSVAEVCRLHKRAVLDVHAVERFETLLKSAQNRDTRFHIWLGNVDALESAFECGVFFDVLAVLVESRRAHAAQFAACEHGLEHIRSVHRTFAFARADNRVQLVDEQNDFALRLFDLVEDGFEPFLELAPVLCARNQRAHIEGEDNLVFQTFGNVAADDSLREPFGDCRFAYTRFADENGVVLGLSRKDSDDAADFVVPADDGVELAFAGELYEVCAVLFEHFVGGFGSLRVDVRRTAHLRYDFFNPRTRDLQTSE